ncbi:hypothetical protein NUACC21_34240 [Scytonema sp. NUACC21]
MKITGILFVDPSVSNYEILLKNVVAGIEPIVLNPDRDGIAQITDTLSHYSGLEGIHIVSHGSPGTLYLGNSELSLSTLEHYTQNLQSWFSTTPITSHPHSSTLLSITASGNPATQHFVPTLFLYGCNVAAGDAGTEFISKLHQLTGANIAASANFTGNAALEGDWNLEVKIGNLTNQPLAFSAAGMAMYPSVLAISAKGSVDTSGYAIGIAVRGNYAYVADGAGGLQIIDISDLSNPVTKGKTATAGAWDVAVDEQYAYVANFDTGFLEIYDVSNPDNPSPVGSYNTGSNRAYDVFVEGNYAYVTGYKPDLSASEYDKELQILDISDRTNPTLVGSYNLDGYGLGVTVVNGYAYVAAKEAGLQILDISDSFAPARRADRANPILKGSYTVRDVTNDAQDVAVRGNYAYVTDGNNGLRIVDISDPTNPILKATFDTSSYASNVALAGKYAYVTDFKAGLQILDISNPAEPVPLELYDTEGEVDGVAVVGKYVYIADGNYGFKILEQSNTLPIADNKTITTDEDTIYTFAATDFNFADIDSGDSLLELQITQLPLTGKLFQDANGNNTQDSGEGTSLDEKIAVADISKLKFQPASDANGTNYSSFQFKVSDGLEFSASAYTMTFDVNAVNDAPTLTDTNVTLATVNKDAGTPTGAVGTLVSSLVSLGSNVTDPDKDAVTGIAIINIDTSKGSFSYSIDDGNTWQSLPSVSDANALLLAADDKTRIYFQPTADFSGEIEQAITFRAWDQTTDSNGLTADTTTNGGATAFSSTTVNAAITVSENVNTAPTLSDTDVTLSVINEDAGIPTGAVGTLVSSLVSLSSNITDPDNNALTGIAVTNVDSTNSSFFYSIDDGSTWQSLEESVSDANALLLAADDKTRIYFQPVANFNGTINNAITFRAWDRTTGNNGFTADTTTNGGATAFSTATDTATITINAVNDAPSLIDTNFITFVEKNAGAPSGAVGALISSLLDEANNITEPDKDALKGVAITSVDTSKGSFFYSIDDGNTWQSLPSVSDANALLLAADGKTRIYFQPTAGFSGNINDIITFRAWDRTTGNNGFTADTIINGGTTAFSVETDTALLTVEDANTPVALKFASNNLGVFQLEGFSDGGGNPKLEVSLTKFSSTQVHELGVVVFDDDRGTINGIAPGADGYALAALQRAQVIFSAIANVPNGFNADLRRVLEFNSGERLGFVLVKNSTIDAVIAGKTPIQNVLFSDVSTNQITDLGNGEFSLAWEDGQGTSVTDFQDLIVKLRGTNESLPLGTGVQGGLQGEAIDLRQQTTQIKAEFVLNREAEFDNIIGFYRVADVNGGIDVNGDGTVDLLPGNSGYAEAAVRGRIPGIDLTVANQSTATFTGTFEPGSLLAPFIIANGQVEAFLDGDVNNNPAVYFPFLNANSGQVDHIRLLGNNTFGFEDLPNGGDGDYNDVTLKVNLTIA